MAHRRLAIFCVLIAACSRQSPENVIVVAEEPQATASKPYEWRVCAPSGIDGFGNKWWGSFSICQGDVRIIVDGYSAHNSAAGLHYEVSTKKCPTGASFANVEDDAFFEKSLADQTRDIKARIARLLRELDPRCGIAPDARGLLDDRFDREYGNLADRYWLGVPKAKIRADRARNRGDR